MTAGATLVYRFEGFELDPGRFELRRDGHDLVMIGISDGQALLAQVMYQANQFARRLESA